MVVNKWISHRGKVVDIHTMTDRWLNNIKKYLKRTGQYGTEKYTIIRNEIKRRKDKRSKHGNKQKK